MHRDLPKYSHVDLLFPSKYVSAGDLRGRDVTVTISDIEPRHSLKTDRGTEHKPLMRFSEAEKGLVLNKTNAKIISKLYGPEATGWIGKRITLYSTEVSAFGEMVTAIRVRPVVPPTPSPAPPAKPEPKPKPAPDEPPTIPSADVDAIPEWTDSNGDDDDLPF